MIKARWDRLDPTIKRGVAVAGGAGLILGVVWLFSGEAEPRESRPSSDDVVRHVLTDRSTRDISLDSLSASLELLKQTGDELRNELDSLRLDLERKEQRSGPSQAVSAELERLQQQVAALAKQNSELEGSLDEELETEEPRTEDSQPTQDNASVWPAASPGNSNTVDAADLFRPQSYTSQLTAPSNEAGADSGAEETSSSSSGIEIYSYVEAESEATEPDKAKEESVYLPAGSILTGTLLNGMDAPTSQGARRDPFPSTLRIQKEAILPNRFRADVKECFVIVSGYGDLSSERAYLRAETISCIREDGGVIEARLEAYVVGEDGKAGIRGRLVSKQGAMIARSMIAGFMSGAADAFDVDAVPIIQTDNISSQTQYQSNFSPSMFQGAAASGASSALDRIAEFYVQMAENIFPVIEVDAGRQVELIMTQGTSLKIR